MLCQGTFQDDVPFPKVGYVSSLEGNVSVLIQCSSYLFTSGACLNPVTWIYYLFIFTKGSVIPVIGLSKKSILLRCSGMTQMKCSHIFTTVPFFLGFVLKHPPSHEVLQPVFRCLKNAFL